MTEFIFTFFSKQSLSAWRDCFHAFTSNVVLFRDMERLTITKSGENNHDVSTKHTVTHRLCRKRKKKFQKFSADAWHLFLKRFPAEVKQAGSSSAGANLDSSHRFDERPRLPQGGCLLIDVSSAKATSGSWKHVWPITTYLRSNFSNVARVAFLSLQAENTRDLLASCN